MVIDNPEDASLLNGTGNFGIGDRPGSLNIVHGGSTLLTNRLGTDVDIVVTLSWN